MEALVWLLSHTVEQLEFCHPPAWSFTVWLTLYACPAVIQLHVQEHYTHLEILDTEGKWTFVHFSFYTYLSCCVNVKKWLIPNTKRFLRFIYMSGLHFFMSGKNDLLFNASQTDVKVTVPNRLTLKKWQKWPIKMESKRVSCIDKTRKTVVR